MVAAPDVVVCFLAALAHNSGDGGCIYLCGGVVAGYCGWIVVSKCICWCCSAPA